MRRVALIITIATAFAAGCSSDKTTTKPERSSSTTKATAPKPTTTTFGSGDDVFGNRYCEILAVTLDPKNTTAEVWGTQGLNDCPQGQFDELDAPSIAKDLGVTIAILNGPRYWVLDRIVAKQMVGSGEKQNFGDLEMRSLAKLDLGPGIPNRAPYTERSVQRDTEFAFEVGTEIHELTAPDGSVYVMQSYSIETDATLTVEALTDLGARLKLPAGWKYESRTLDEELVVEDIEGIATVIQDDFNNSYQLASRP